MKRIRITDIRATTDTVPLEAALRHANGCHWARFVRTIVEVDTDAGITGLGKWAAAVRAREEPSEPSKATWSDRGNFWAVCDGSLSRRGQ